MGGHGTELEVRSTHHIKGIYSNKKKHNEKFGKTQKKLPDLATSGYNESYAKKPVGGFASDSDEYLAAAQLPMIKGGGSIHAQNVADAYILSNQATTHMKNKQLKQSQLGQVTMGGLSQMNSGFNQSKYISGNSSHANNSQSPAS